MYHKIFVSECAKCFSTSRIICSIYMYSFSLPSPLSLPLSPFPSPPFPSTSSSTPPFLPPPPPPSQTHSLPTQPTVSLSIPPQRPHDIRWFYQEPSKYWQPFNGHDSLSIEACYQNLLLKKSSADGVEVPVLGDMYEVNVLEKSCKPIYWTGQSSVGGKPGQGGSGYM